MRLPIRALLVAACLTGLVCAQGLAADAALSSDEAARPARRRRSLTPPKPRDTLPGTLSEGTPADVRSLGFIRAPAAGEPVGSGAGAGGAIGDGPVAPLREPDRPRVLRDPDGPPLETDVRPPMPAFEEPEEAAAPSSAPDNEEAKRHLSAAYQKKRAKDWAGVAADASSALKLEQSFEALKLRTEAFLWLKRFAEAEHDARAALDHRSDSAVMHFYLAWALYKSGRLNEALEAAQESRRHDTNNATNWMLLATLYDRFGRRQDALQAVEEAANLDKRFRGRAEDAKSGGRVSFDMAGEGTGAAFAGIQRLLHLLGPVLFGITGLLVAVGLGWAGWMLYKPAPAPRSVPAALRSSRPETALPGLLAGKYETIRVIGRGGMGDVLEARDTSLNRTVAVKRLSTRLADVGAQGRELMIQEARTVAQLHHPAIVDVFEAIEDEENLFLVFEFISGKTVQQLLAECRRLTVDQTVEILKPVCQALDFAHSRGVVHRDLKPSNIMITEDGYPKLMDFGIARRMADRGPQLDAAQAQAPIGVGGGIEFARTRTIVGTPLYMAPEMEQGIVCKESDVYSLGVCAYEMLTGDRPFMEPATAFQKIQMDFLKPSLRVPELPAAIDEVLIAALQPTPESRTHSAKEFIERLKAASKPLAAQG